jgi:PadR family transcriptional regulator PadR
MAMGIVLGDFEQLVMLSLMRQGSDAYGVSICDDITARTKRDVSLGAVYKTLERLEDKGLVSSRFGEPTAERGGRRKKHFKLLAPGHRALKDSMAALRNMTDGLEAEFKL